MDGWEQSGRQFVMDPKLTQEMAEALANRRDVGFQAELHKKGSHENVEDQAFADVSVHVPPEVGGLASIRLHSEELAEDETLEAIVGNLLQILGDQAGLPVEEVEVYVTRREANDSHSTSAGMPEGFRVARSRVNQFSHRIHVLESTPAHQQVAFMDVFKLAEGVFAADLVITDDRLMAKEAAESFGNWLRSTLWPDPTQQQILLRTSFAHYVEDFRIDPLETSEANSSPKSVAEPNRKPTAASPTESNKSEDTSKSRLISASGIGGAIMFVIVITFIRGGARLAVDGVRNQPQRAANSEDARQLEMLEFYTQQHAQRENSAKEIMAWQDENSLSADDLDPILKKVWQLQNDGKSGHSPWQFVFGSNPQDWWKTADWDENTIEMLSAVRVSASETDTEQLEASKNDRP